MPVLTHRHVDVKEAQRCGSPACIANARDRAYFTRHQHYDDVAPVPGCEACAEDKDRAEKARRGER